MKIDKTKLYADMSNQDRAKTAFKLTAQNDDLGLDELISTVDKKTIVMNHPAFSLRSTGLYHTAILWGFHYQQMQGSYLMAMGIIAMTEPMEETNKLLDGARIMIERSRDKLTILFSLLDELDTSHGLHAESTHRVAEINPELIKIDHDTKDKCEALMSYYNDMKELFTISLTDFERSKLSEH